MTSLMVINTENGLKSEPTELRADSGGTEFTGAQSTSSLRSMLESPIPTFAVARFADAALEACTVELLEDGTYYIEAEVVPGVWGQGDSEAAASHDFAAALEEWVAQKLVDGDDDFPVLADVNFNPPTTASA